MEQATGIIMATIFLFSGQPDYTKLHPAEVIQLVDDGVTILKSLPPYEGEQFTRRAALFGPANTAALVPNQQQVLELGWRGNAPRYYLAQEAPDLYRRIELADREGYTVSLVSAGDAPEPAVQVEVTRNALVSGTYDAALDAFVGKPTLVKTVCTTSASVKPGRNTVVIWRPPTGPAARGPAPAAADGAVPPWAIGKWHLEAGGDATVMEVRADGAVVFSDWPDTPFPGEMTVDGAVWLNFAPEGEDDRVLVIGRLNPDGTGGGRICQIDAEQGGNTWTAVRLAPPGDAGPMTPLTPPARPGEPPLVGPAADVLAWAIGKWRMQAGRESIDLELRADGTVVFSDDPEAPIPAEIAADGGVWLDWVPEGEDERWLLVGRLSPDGTGAGAVCQVDDQQDDSVWTATRLGPQGEAAPMVAPPQWPAPRAALPVAPADRQSEPPGIGILLTAGADLAGTGSKTAPAASGAANAQIELSTLWTEVVVGSDEWNALMAADDKAELLRQLVADKRVKVVSKPRLLVLNNRRAEMATAFPVPPVMPPRAAQAPPAERVPLTNSLCVTPRLLADGNISMAVETRFEHVGGWVTGPEGEIVPIVTYQAANTRMVAVDGQTVAMGAFSIGAPEPGEDGRPVTQPTETVILLTPRVVNREDLPPPPADVAQQGEEEAQLAACRTNVKQLCLAANMYADDHNGILPTEDWPDQLLPYCKGAEAYVCPAVTELEVGYALNPAVAGLALSDIKRPANLVLFFEADLVEGRPPGDAQAALTAPRHGQKIVVGLVDGYVRTAGFEELQELLQRDPFE